MSAAPVRVIDSAAPHTGVGKFVRELFQSEALRGRLEHVRLDRGVRAAVSRPSYDAGEATTLARLPLPLPPAFWAAACSALVPRSDIVHAVHQNLPGARGRFRIVTVHDLFYATHPRGMQDRVLARTLYPFLPRYDLFLCDSADSAEGLERLLGIAASRIRVVPLVVDIPDLAALEPLPPDLAGRRYVLHVSSEEPRKNFATLLRAFSRVASLPGNDDLLLVKVGRAARPDFRAAHLALASELGVAPRLRVLEGVPDTLLASLYANARVMAMPSESEGFGYPLAEALAVGCPAVAGNCPALREIGGNLVPYAGPKDVDAWSRALEASLERDSSPQERAALRQRAGLFSREAFGRRMAEAYAEGS